MFNQLLRTLQHSTIRAKTGLLVTILLLPTSALANQFGVPTGQYDLEPTHAYITFSYSHLGFSTPHVSFDKFDVTLNADADSPTKSQVSVNIDAASINSRVAEFDDHLNGDQYFDTGKFPTITFVSTEIKELGENMLAVTGDLTIKEVTKPVTLTTSINKTGNHPFSKLPTIGISGSAKLSRTEFGLGLYAPAVGDEVTIYITAELIKQK